MGWAPTLTWLRWGPKYQLHRRVLQPPFSKSKVGQYTAMQRKEALVCCKGMMDDPANWLSAVRRCSVAIVLKIAYGLDVDSPESPWIGLAERSASAIGRAGAPGSSIMDVFPASKPHPQSVCIYMQPLPSDADTNLPSQLQPAIFQTGCRLWNVYGMPTLGAPR